MRKNVLIVDFSNLSTRTFFAIDTRTSDGTYSGMFYGVLKIINNKIKRHKIDEVVIAYDRKPYWRSILFPEYKQGRKGVANSLSGELLEAYLNQSKDLETFFLNSGFKNVAFKSFEADDIAGAYAEKLSDKGYNVFTFSGDHDWLQLVKHKNVSCIQAKTKVNDLVYTAENFEELMGINVDDYINQLAIAGDKGDGIPSIFAERIVENDEVYWQDPPRIISPNKVAKILNSPHNSVENLLEGKLNSIKGIGGKTADLFLNITEKQVEAYHRNYKLVNLTDGNEKYEAMKNFKNEFEKSVVKPKVLEHLIQKYECMTMRILNDFPYFSDSLGQNANEPDISNATANRFKELLGA